MSITQKELPLKQTVDDEQLDLLNRQPFVDQLIRVANMLADNKKNACFAINGRWGVGKTYVLDLFEKQIRDYSQEGTTLGKFLVLHYNCWQYDYYEEPLIAIVSAIMDAIDEEVCLLSTETKTKIKAAMREIAVEFLHGAAQFTKHKTGIDFEKGISVLKKAKEQANSKEQDNHNYDAYFDFKKKLTKLKEQIGTLAQEQTVLFIVDELDRCLPEYAIKVLERLHHIFDDIPNVQVILSVDKQQLENTVTQIYGTNTQVDTYLAKFIDFELYLDEGTIREFDQRFQVYVQNFDAMWKGTTESDVEQFVSELLEGISTRQRIALVEKCQLIHSMISADEIMDKSIMCVELFLSLLQSCGLHLENAKRNFSINNLFVENPSATQPILKQVTKGLQTISQRYRVAQSTKSSTAYLRPDPTIGDVYYVRTNDVLGVSLAAYRRVVTFEKDYWLYGEREDSSLEEHIDKFWEALQIIN